MKKLELKTVLYSVVQHEKDYSYYQGLNFITELFYVEYGMLRAYLIMDALAHYMFSSFMAGTKTFDDSLNKRITYSHIILQEEIQHFEEIISFDAGLTAKDKSMHRLNFAVSWFLTLFAYKINDHQVILRIFDFLICCLNPYGISYVVAAVLKTMFESKSINEHSDKGEVMALVFNGNFNDVDFDKVINRAFELMNKPEYQLTELEKKADKMNKISLVKNLGGKLFSFFGKK